MKEKEVIDLSFLPVSSYVVHEQLGDCKVCKKYDDLRFGVCFDCADFVVSDGDWAWDIRKPYVKWNVKAN